MDKNDRHARIIAVVQCTYCGAMKGELCWNAHSRQTTSFVHGSRAAAYKRKRGVPQAARKPVRLTKGQRPQRGPNAPGALARSMEAMQRRNAQRAQAGSGQ